MDDQNNDLNSPVQPVSSVNRDDEEQKDSITRTSGDSDGEHSSLGSAGPEDDPDDVMDIDKAREAMGLSSDGDGEHQKELSDDDLNNNALNDVSTPRQNDEEELNKAD